MDMVPQVMQKINDVFNDNYLSDLAYESGFIRRKRKIMAGKFLEKMIITTLSATPTSLEDLAAELETQNNTLSKQALHKKFNEHTVEFTQKVLHSLLEGVVSERKMCLGAIPHVNNVIVGDSSKISLAQLLNAQFPDTRNSKGAAVKVQAIRIFLSEQL
jgi:hypothetical protein